MKYKILFTFLIIFLPLPVYYLVGFSVLSPFVTFVAFFTNMGRIFSDIVNPLHSYFQSLEYVLMVTTALFALISLTLQIIFINIFVNYTKKIFEKNFTNIIQNIFIIAIVLLLISIIIFLPLFSLDSNESVSLLTFLEGAYEFLLE